MSVVLVGVVVLLAIVAVAGAALALCRRSWPVTPAFARPRPVTSPGGPEPDPNAGFFTDRAFLVRKGIFSSAPDARRCWSPIFRHSTCRVGNSPCGLPGSIRAWWWFGDGFHREAAGPSADDLLARVRDRARKRRTGQDRARLLSAVEESRRKRENG